MQILHLLMYHMYSIYRLLSGLLWLIGVMRISMKSQASYMGSQIRTSLTRYQIGLIIAALCTIIYVDGVSLSGTTLLSQSVSWGILGNAKKTF